MGVEFFVVKEGVVVINAGTATNAVSDAAAYAYVVASNSIGEIALIGGKSEEALRNGVDAYKAFEQGNGYELAKVTGSVIIGDAAALAVGVVGWPEFLIGFVAGELWNMSWDFSRDFWRDYYGLNNDLSPMTDSEFPDFLKDLRQGYHDNGSSCISPTLGTTPDPLVKTARYVDPLILDLDGDGLEITPLSKGIQFDANGDSIKTGTAWVGADDGLLVLDRNGNGSIDSGAELFGDETVLANGAKAANGFAALSELDSNHDGLFSAADSQYNAVRIWRDLNQDGISQAGELKTLLETGVQSIKLASTATNTNYGDAQLVQSGAFTRTDGSTGQAGSFILAQNNFVRTFTPLTASDAAMALPDIKGSGWVRDLREAPNDGVWRMVA